MAKILLIEDENHIAQGIILNLELQGHKVIHYISGKEGYESFFKEEYDLLILDLMLPEMTGEEVIQKIREKSPRFPVLILSAKDEAKSKIKLFQLGTDDYLAKPFHLEEFLLRVERLLQRSSWTGEDKETTEKFEFSDYWIDFANHRGCGVDGEFDLTEQELKLLKYFTSRCGKIVRRAELLAEIGYSESSESRTLDNFIVRFRKYFEQNPKSPQYFINVRGVGYKFNYQK